MSEPLPAAGDGGAEDFDVKLLRQALPYMRQHRGKTLVVKLGGHLVKDRDALENLSSDIALLHHVGMRICVVHGGGPQATELQERLGVEPQFVEGRRITDDATLEVAKMVFAGKINIEMLSALRAEGLHAVGLNGLSGGLITARRREALPMTDPATGEVRSVDFGHVGDIENVDSRVLRTLMDAGYVPVVASLGADGKGNVLNINADNVSLEMAVDLKADKFLNLTQVPGVMRDLGDEDSLLTDLTADEADRLMAEGVVRGGMIPKVRTCVSAVRRGIPRAHILNGLEPHSILLELFTVKGTGTMISLERVPQGEDQY
ncbi:MAG: acetylglutamate kinase [Planctomycetaceae bacterium]|nr:acetylglutamate kinase [Planctomycetota bacterium]NUN53780.1 acetylglutamate kinase [Planctomycetaceae bacterium]